MNLIYVLFMWITIWILPFYVKAGEKLALLSATLRTYQRAACDSEQMTLSCPRGTSISIELAQYGRHYGNDGITIEDLCPSDPLLQMKSTQDNNNSNNNNNHNNPSTQYNNDVNLTNFKNSNNSNSNNNSGLNTNYITSSNNNNNNIRYNTGYSRNTTSTSTSHHTISSNFDGSNDTGAVTNLTANGSSRSNSNNTPENCMWPNALQYSLLQTVVEACQKKKHCKFNASPGTYNSIGLNSGVGEDSSGLSNSFHSSTSISSDPCPKVRKFVEIAYKCRPYEFRSKVACENDVIQLECNPYSRIVIYSSSFGRTEYESIQCPQPQGVKEETCLASYATETVMQICHGRRRCSLSADSTTFGSPCNPNSKMYLKVVYTCVPKQVLKDRYESLTEHDEPEHFDGDNNDLYDEDQFYKESEAIPKLYSNLTHNINTLLNGTSIDTSSGSTINPIVVNSKGMNLQDDQERLYFYLLIAGLIGVLLCITLVVIRVIIYKRHQSNVNQTTTTTTTTTTTSTTSPKCETTIPNGFNDSISEIDADIDLTTPVPIPSVSKNENYITYGPTSSLYGSLGPSNVSHTSSTILLPTNTMMCARQSPDIIGVANTYIGQPPSSHLSNNSAVGTIVPINSLAQYTTAPTYHTGYIMDPEGVLRRPISQVQSSHPLGMTVPTAIHSSLHQQHQQQQQPLLSKQQSLSSSSGSAPTANIVGVGGINAGAVPGVGSYTTGNAGIGNIGIMQPTSLETFQYDGTAPRTLSTGVAQNSDFYYG